MRISPVFLALALAACGHADPRGLIAMSRVDPLQDDPAGFAVAVEVPAIYRLDPQGVRLALTVAIEGEDPRTDSFALRRVDLPGPRPAAQVFTLAGADAEKLRQVQADAAATKAAGGHGSISIAVDIAACLVTPAVDGAAVAGSVWMRTKADAGFAPLFLDVPAAEIPEWKDAAAGFRPCPS